MKMQVWSFPWSDGICGVINFSVEKLPLEKKDYEENSMERIESGPSNVRIKGSEPGKKKMVCSQSMIHEV